MKIYNSLTRKKEDFDALKKGRVGMYVCGPTVYDEPHIGHARSAYIFDCVRRYFEYRKFKVMFVRNVTDVDDKIINKAKKEGATVKEISKKYLAAYHEDMALLGIGKPDKEPRATEYIPKMIKFIEFLIKKECAYASGGDVYFDIRKSKDYGKLSNQDTEKMESGVRSVRSETSNRTKIAPDEVKKDPLDFALWKSAKENEPSWDSPWGKGRPGWHIECSVMSSDILGDEFDIHGGGIDLIFPHHENEIAQSEGAGKKFAKYWIHNGLLTINGEKMAKSLGNYITIKDFIGKYKDPDFLKLLFLNTHYRHPVDYNEDKIAEMRSQKERFLILAEKLERILKRPGTGGRAKETEGTAEFRKKFEEAMDDDFNTPLALAVLFDLVTHANKFIQDRNEFNKAGIQEAAGIKQALSDLGAIFGLNLLQSANMPELDEKNIPDWIVKREQARKKGDFKLADEIRKKLCDKGIILEDTKAGTVWRRKI